MATEDGWPDELRPFLDLLSVDERAVLLLRFGLDRGEPRTREEVAQALGLSRDAVRDLEERAMAHLRASGGAPEAG
jgi:DNA-directed RNA polymerase sigma subunit (sigma70/sigma32)